MKANANIIVGAIVAIAVLASVCALVFMQNAQPDGRAAMWAVVHDGAGGEHRLELSRDQEARIVTDLGENVVAVEDGSVYVRAADCENHDCMHQGRINVPGKQIICLPHKLWIEVVAEGSEGAGAMDVSAAPKATNADGDLDVVAR